MNGFHSFSATHWIALTGVAASIGLFVAGGLRWRGTRRQRALEIAVATVILLFRGGILIWNLLPSHFAVVHSLPLQICDLAAICSAFALLGHRRWLESIAYFWGLALSIQGLIQPDLQGGPRALGFWLFWLHHALIVGTALYLIAVRGFRPTYRDLGVALGIGVSYAVVIFGLDVAFGFNYGYLGQALPSQPTILGWLGPWPWRALVIVALASLAMAILLVPWVAISATRPNLPAATREAGPPTV